ncbi:hypothetical protein [Phaeodactylibacter xiamenensis]|uniref:hypothetical protein n=1 Tax=Phaeodactylibacter xiamenensis TaxID=1524460 RepID=UPI0024A9A469|nr:hypothetical protein [Phaeodactylibacter xiamenensis]
MPLQRLSLGHPVRSSPGALTFARRTAPANAAHRVNAQATAWLSTPGELIPN